VKVKHLLLWLPPILWGGLIWFVSSMPHLTIPKQIVFPNIDKAAHLGEYTIFSFLLTRAFVLSFIGKASLFSWLLLVLYGGMDEIHQLFVPGRACDIKDFITDIAGAVLGILLFHYFQKRREKRNFIPQ
jgi:VanZ family protein